MSLCPAAHSSLILFLQELFNGGPWNKIAAEREAKAVVAALMGLEPPTQYAAILLSHDYTHENPLRPEILKGSDWALYEAVSQAFPVHLLPVVTRSHWTLDIENEYGYEGNTVFSCYAFILNKTCFGSLGRGPSRSMSGRPQHRMGRWRLSPLRRGKR